MARKVTAIMQQKRDTAANWDAVDPILAAGEIGYILDTGEFKIGDGVTDWTLLPLSTGIGEAPLDAKTYGRNNGAWVEVVVTIGGTNDINMTTGNINFSSSTGKLDFATKSSGGIYAEFGSVVFKQGAAWWELNSGSNNVRVINNSGNDVFQWGVGTFSIGTSTAPITPTVNGTHITIGYGGITADTGIQCYDTNKPGTRFLGWDFSNQRFEYEDNAGVRHPVGAVSGRTSIYTGPSGSSTITLTPSTIYQDKLLHIVVDDGGVYTTSVMMCYGSPATWGTNRDSDTSLRLDRASGQLTSTNGGDRYAIIYAEDI